ncbi:MAG: undecaprenyl-diphosphate phosphatase [bacterium]
MNIWQAIILGALQGATEFLPVSSDGHLVLAEHLLGLKSDGQDLVLFNILVHMATLLAIFIAYREDLTNLILAACNKATEVKSPKFGLEMRDIWYTPGQARAILWWMILATFATGILYLLTKDFIDPYLTDIRVAGFGFLATCALLVIGQKLEGGSLNIRSTGAGQTAVSRSAANEQPTPNRSRRGGRFGARTGKASFGFDVGQRI